LPDSHEDREFDPLLRAGPPLVPFDGEIQPKSRHSAERRRPTDRRMAVMPAKPQAFHSFSTETPTSLPAWLAPRVNRKIRKARRGTPDSLAVQCATWLKSPRAPEEGEEWRPPLFDPSKQNFRRIRFEPAAA